MKSSIFFSLALLFLFACKNDVAVAPISTTVFSGKIIDPNGNKVIISRGDYKEEIPVNEAGAFSAKLNDLDEGYYTFYDTGESSTFYILPGKDIELSLDTKEFDESISYSGVGAGPSNYLATKYMKEENNGPDMKTLFSNEEQAFKEAIGQLKLDQMNFLANHKELPESFVNLEMKAINYAYLGNIAQYQNAHAYYSEKEGFKPSAEFLKPLSVVDKDNETDFKNIVAYKQLVLGMIEADNVEETLVNLADVKSKTIRNAVLERLKYHINPGSETLEADYKALLAAAADETYKKEITESYEVCLALAAGQPSPDFNFEDRNGKMVKLDDLKGKNVYIDVWATWCGPCIAEIPDLKQLEQDYHDENVEFVSISIDKMKDKDKWLKMIEEKELAGVQLFSDKDWKSDFVTGYGIKGIPRFILVDSKGKIVSADAPRPSSGDKIRGMIDAL